MMTGVTEKLQMSRIVLSSSSCAVSAGTIMAHQPSAHYNLFVVLLLHAFLLLLQLFKLQKVLDGVGKYKINAQVVDVHTQL